MTTQQIQTPKKPAASEIAARCHEIQTGLGLIEVPEFGNLREIGMGVRLALHMRGLPTIKFETLRLVAVHFLRIPAVAVKTIVELLAEVEFVKIQKTGATITAFIPAVPYYEALYSTLGDYAANAGLNEPERLSIELLCRLAKASTRRRWR